MKGMTDSNCAQPVECVEQLSESDKDVALGQAVEFAEYVERQAKGTMREAARRFLSLPYSQQIAARLAEIEALRAEVEKWKVPCLEWLDKTEWVQQTIKPRKLGRHRADILRERIQQAEVNTERLAEALRDLRDRVLPAALHYHNVSHRYVEEAKGIAVRALLLEQEEGRG